MPRRVVHCLGVSQLVCWGISYYLIGGLGDLMVADLGWSRTLVYGGFSASLAVMGATSRLAGRLIDRHGGRPVMVAGSCLIAIACVGLALAHSVAVYYGAWVVMGIAMRFSLYEAAFASLARIAGPAARRPISQITLLGGLASTAFWPIGNALAAAFGWRGAALAYAAIAVATIPLHLAIPDTRHQHSQDTPGAAVSAARPAAADSPRLAAWLYAGSAALASFVNSGMSAHTIPILVGLGLSASFAVTIASLRGVGQSAARLAEILFGGRLDPLDLNLFACLGMALCFVAGLLAASSTAMAFAFAAIYGTGNGLMTITRGTLPLVLFDARRYGTIVGRLLAPSFYLSAAAPLAYAWIIERLGDVAALDLSLALGIAVFGGALWLRLRFGGRVPA